MERFSIRSMAEIQSEFLRGSMGLDQKFRAFMLILDKCVWSC
jgi:hypothetical protein